MLPPLPPSPPDGPPRGTYFSRRKATHPLPPLPAFTKILASSTNKAKHPCQIRLPGRAKTQKRFCTSRTAQGKPFWGTRGVGSTARFPIADDHPKLSDESASIERNRSALVNSLGS